MNFNNQIKVVCFDYYMTLVEIKEPFEMIQKWITNYLFENCIKVDTKRFNSRFVKERAVIAAGNTFMLGIDMLAESLNRTCKRFGISSFCCEFVAYVEEVFTNTNAYPDSHLLVNELRKNYKVGLLTNADNYILEKSVKAQKFDFDFIITSEDARCNKPDNGIFKYAMERLSIKNDELIMIGDSQNDDLFGAGKMGISTIWINRNGEAIKDGIIPPLFIVNNLEEILEHVCEVNNE